MNKHVVTLITLILICCSNLAIADDQSIFSPVTLRASTSHIIDADFDNSEASSSVTGGRVRLNAGGFSMSYEGKYYSWDNVDQLDFGNGKDNPWDALHRITLAYNHNGVINKNWFYGAGITGTSAFEEEMSDSFGGAVRGHIGYIFNENWKGFIGTRAFINSIRFSAMPYAGVSYQNFDKDGAGLFINAGLPANEVGYSFSKTATLRASFSIDSKTYRLKDDSSVSSAGYVETSSMIAGVYYDWKPLKNVSVSFGPEYYFSRDIKTYDKHGDKFGETTKQDAAVGGILNLRYSF